MTDRPLILMNDWVRAGSPRALADAALGHGYDGIELWWPVGADGKAELEAVVGETGIPVSLMVASADPDPAGHRRDLEAQLREISEAGIRPLHITLHAGRDHWAGPELDDLAEWVVQRRTSSGMDILVETHRARMLSAAHTAARLLRRHPELRVTLDVSHWVVSAESLLQDQPEAVALAIDRTDHIHARFGHAQSPQIDDPWSDRWRAAVCAHLGWWDRVVERQRAEGRRPTFLAEFGPADYATVDPRTGRPLGDPAVLNLWIAELLRARYAMPGG